MRRPSILSGGAWRNLALGLTLALVVLAPGGVKAGPEGPARTTVRPQASPTWQRIEGWVNQAGRRFVAWYRATPPVERITWGGLAVSALMGLVITLDRSIRLRRSRTIPTAFVERFQRRLSEGLLERGKGLDYCELNPSPAARVALAAIKRWGRPVTDLERAVSLARQIEADRLRRHVGTLRRIAALAPLIGLLGTLTGASRALAALPPGAAWGPVVAEALAPLTAGVALAILALVAYDGLAGRVESLAHDLDRLGAETIDAIALATAASEPRASRTVRSEPAGPARSPHPLRLPIPEDVVRQMERPYER